MMKLVVMMLVVSIPAFAEEAAPVAAVEQEAEVVTVQAPAAESNPVAADISNAQPGEILESAEDCPYKLNAQVDESGRKVILSLESTRQVASQKQAENASL